MQEFTEHILPLYDVVSFDLFDTFLLRPVLEPRDLFRIVGGEAFKEARGAAENEAQHRRGSYTIDDIYECIDNKYKHLKAEELAAETRLIEVNPLMLKVYNRARELGKKVVFMSDMYLPENAMRSLLAAKGITEYDGLYVSCSRGCGKWDGALFQLMLKQLAADPQRVVHIGDNCGTDIDGGRRAGIYTQYVPKIQDTFFDENPRLRKFFDMCGGRRNPRMRLFFGALVLSWHMNKCANGDDPWRRTGITYTAPLFYSYTRWVLEQAKKMGRTKLLLVLRDCHVVGKMLERIAPDVDYGYIVGSRMVLRPITERGARGTDTKEYAACMAYVKSRIPDPDNTVVVEATSAWRTVEKGVAHALGRKIPTLYMNLAAPERKEGEAYLDASGYIPFYNLLETAGCAPENPYTGEIVDGEPVCRPYSPYDMYRKCGIQRRARAAAETAARLHANGIYLTEEECKRFVECCYDDTDLRDSTFLTNQLCAGDLDHRYYVSWYRR